MNAHRQRLYDYLTGDTHIKLTKRERAKIRRMQERRINRVRVHFQRVYFTYPILRSDGTHEYTPGPPAYYGKSFSNDRVDQYWGSLHAGDDSFALHC